MTGRAPRRLVTGTDAEGKAVFVDAGEVPFAPSAMAPEGAVTGVWALWASDERVALPSDGAEPPWAGAFPPAAGFRYKVLEMGPGASFPMHRTATVDIGVVLAGEVWLELDDGVEDVLRQGDYYVQNGTIHAWHNRGDETCVLAIILIGADAPEGFEHF